MISSEFAYLLVVKDVMRKMLGWFRALLILRDVLRSAGVIDGGLSVTMNGEELMLK